MPRVRSPEPSSDLQVTFVDGRLPATGPEEEKFAELFADSYEAAIRLAREAFPTGDRAWDVVQGTLCELWAKRRRLTPEQRTRRYLLATVSSRMKDELRRMKAADHWFVALEDGVDASAAGPATELSQEMHMAEIRADYDIARRMVDRLPRQARIVLLLRRVAGMTYPEIAAALGITEVAVRGHVCRAQKLLRAQMDAAGFRLQEPATRAVLQAGAGEEA